MITMKDRDRIPVSYRRRLDDLAARYPVGSHVRHVDGWTGRVVPDFAGNRFGLDLPGEAHCLPDGHGSAVCVEATISGYAATVWYRPAVLQPIGKGTPAPRPTPSTTRTTRARRRTRGPA